MRRVLLLEAERNGESVTEAIELHVRIHPNERMRIKQKFYTISNLTEACILGIDFSTKINAKKDSGNRRITYTNNESRYNIIGKIELKEDESEQNETKLKFGKEGSRRYEKEIK